jgi:hypothetical protein
MEQPSVTDRLAFGDRALREVIEAMPLIEFEPSKRPQLYAVTLHASIVQLCGGCLALAKTEHTAGIPVLLRSMYEALVDLQNLVLVADFHERMDAANLTQFLKPIKGSATNPLLAGLEKRHDIATITAQYQAELDALIARGRGPQDLRQRCIAVGREHEYTSLYWILCLDAHNNTTALIDRHVSEGESQRLQVDAFGDGNPLGLANRIFTSVGWMLCSAEYAHGAFKTGFGVAELQRECESFRIVTEPCSAAPSQPTS